MVPYIALQMGFVQLTDLTPYMVFAQAMGFVGMALNIVSYQRKKRRDILLLTMCGGLFYALHFFLLGTYTSVAMNLIGAARSLVYSQSDKKWAQSPAWLGVFLAVFLIAGALTYEDFYSVFAISAMILSTFSLWIKKELYIRLITFPSSPMWLTYDWHAGSIPGVLTECFVMTSILVALLRYDLIPALKRRKIAHAAPSNC